MEQNWGRYNAEDRCGNCKFWAATDQNLLPKDNGKAGQCRRHAPTRNVSEVQLAARVSRAIHDVGLRILEAAGKQLVYQGRDDRTGEFGPKPIPEHSRHYTPEDDDVPSGDGDKVYLQQLWPITLDWAWCGEHEPLESPAEEPNDD